MVISLISIAILFSVIASSQINYVKPVACKKASKNNFACRALVTYKLQTSFSALVKPENPLVQKSKTRKMNEFSKETVFFFTFCSTCSFFLFVFKPRTTGILFFSIGLYTQPKWPDVECFDHALRSAFCHGVVQSSVMFNPSLPHSRIFMR